MRTKSARPSEPIDDEFFAVVLTNQMNYNTETYRLKRFALPEQEEEDDYPADYAFTANIQKYINRVAARRLELYKHAMRDIESVTSAHIINASYMRLLEESNRIFLRKTFSFEYLMEYSADICTYTRCAYMKGLNPSKYWPIRVMAEYLYMLRSNGLFFDRFFGELDRWLSSRVQEIERESGPMSLNPIELSLDWTNYPPPRYINHIFLNPDLPSNLDVTPNPRSFYIRIYEQIIEDFERNEEPREAETSEGNSRKPEISENILGTSETFENMAGNSVATSDNHSISYDSSDALSTHTETSDDFSGNYNTSEDEYSDDSENTRGRRISSGAFRGRRKSLKKRQKKNKKLLYLRI